MFGGKAIILHLPTQGETEQQIMSSIPAKVSRATALQYAMKLSDLVFYDGGLVERIKLECSIDKPGAVFRDGYFEGHLTLDMTGVSTDLRNALKSDLKMFDAHLSNSAFKPNTYMITVRMYDTDKQKFDQNLDRIQMLTESWLVEFGPFEGRVKKKIREFCYYDTNHNLDKNWLHR